jgi:PAS domain S-box-containing protein
VRALTSALALLSFRLDISTVLRQFFAVDPLSTKAFPEARVPQKKSFNNIVSRLTQIPWAMAGLTLALGIVASWQVGMLDTERRLSEDRSQAINDLATVRARLEGVINTVFSATSGLTEVIAHQGSITPDLFKALAQQAIKEQPQIRNIVAAPGNVVAMLYPVEGNGPVLGLDYATVPEQFAGVQRAMETGRPIFAGPLHLVQGGRGLIGRSPVFTRDNVEPGASPRYWGVVSMVTHLDALLDASGVSSSATLDIGLRTLEDRGHPGMFIGGMETVFSEQPVWMTVAVPGGAWKIAAVRKGGWAAATPMKSILFYVGLANSFSAAACIWWLVARPHLVRVRNQELHREIDERARTEEELRLSEQKYATIFQLMPDMVGITRVHDGTFVEINDGFTHISGWTREEVLGRTSIDLGLWTPEDREAAMAVVKERGRLDNYAFSLGVKSGEKRQALMFLTTIRVKGEECLYFMARDVTELKQAQVVLEQERARLGNLLQTVPALIWMKDPDGRYLNCNSRFERFFGAREAEIVGRTDYDFVDRELADFFRENDCRAVVAGKASVNEEWVTYADDGHRELLETVKTPVFDGAGNLLGVLGVGWNITEKNRIEEELRTERTRFMNLVDSVDGIVWETDAETFVFTYVSKQAERLLGHPSPVWRQEGFWRNHLHPEDRETVAAYSATCTAQGEDHELEYRFLAHDGAVFWVQDFVTVVVEDGRPRWRRGIMVDVTSKKEEEKERRNLEFQLRQAQKIEAIGRLAGGVAHDFNNQLSVILGYADLIQNTAADPVKTRGYVNQILKAATLSRDVTRQLLAFSRQEAISPQALDLNALVVGVKKGLGRLIREDIRFEVRLAHGLWPILMDPTQVDQVIMNLIVNARDAMENGGLLVVETSNVCLDDAFARQHPEIAAGDYVQLMVGDTGCGMSAQTLLHIFEPFYTTKETGKGTGLGLATVYGIVSQNKGLVLVESEPGRGSAFRLYFPRSEAALPDQAEPMNQLLLAERSGVVLLVEDEETVRQMATDILMEGGYTVLAAATPQEALAISANSAQKIDLLLTDVIMPEINGRELSRSIKGMRPEIKVLFMSGYAADILSEGGEDAATSFIKKPFSVQALLEIIERQLSVSGAQRG